MRQRWLWVSEPLFQLLLTCHTCYIQCFQLRGATFLCFATLFASFKNSIKIQWIKSSPRGMSLLKILQVVTTIASSTTITCLLMNFLARISCKISGTEIKRMATRFKTPHGLGQYISTSFWGHYEHSLEDLSDHMCGYNCWEQIISYKTKKVICLILNYIQAAVPAWQWWLYSGTPH